MVLHIVRCLEAQYQAATEYHSFELSAQLELKVDGSTPFFIACQEGNLQAAKALQLAGADDEATDGHGATPFYSACQHGHAAVVEHLAGLGVDTRKGIELVDRESGATHLRSPVEAATAGGHGAVLELLERFRRDEVAAALQLRDEAAARAATAQLGQRHEPRGAAATSAFGQAKEHALSEYDDTELLSTLHGGGYGGHGPAVAPWLVGSPSRDERRRAAAAALAGPRRVESVPMRRRTAAKVHDLRIRRQGDAWVAGLTNAAGGSKFSNNRHGGGDRAEISGFLR